MELFQKGVWLCSSEAFEDAALGQHSEDLLDELLAANPGVFFHLSLLTTLPGISPSQDREKTRNNLTVLIKITLDEETDGTCRPME